jgi:curved DNA-binding protein
MVKYKDYYAILGIDRNSAKKEIRKAYLQLAKKYHPDVNSDKEAEERFKELQEAYEVLHDKEKRKRYDGLDGTWEPDQYAAKPTNENGQQYHGNANDFSDFFNQFFASGGGRSSFFQDEIFINGEQRFPVQLDEEAQLYITLEEAIQGAEMRIHIQGRDLNVKLPIGVRNGQKIRLKGQSTRKTRNGKRGDLYIILLLKPHPQFTIDKYDLKATLHIAPWHAALGAEATIQALDGTKLSVRIPPGMNGRKKLRISKQGLMKENGQRGDLFLEMELMLPSPPTDQEKALYAQLSQMNSFQPSIK